MMNSLFPLFVLFAIGLLIVFTELIKRLDRRNRFKRYRVWIPATLSGGAAWLLRIGEFFTPPGQVWFWWAVIFAFSIFGYEAFLKKINTAIGADDASKDDVPKNDASKT
jgi:hypothetical protein